jgi:hypothetical protein
LPRLLAKMFLTIMAASLGSGRGGLTRDSEYG